MFNRIKISIIYWFNRLFRIKRTNIRSRNIQVLPTFDATLPDDTTISFA